MLALLLALAAFAPFSPAFAQEGEGEAAAGDGLIEPGSDEELPPHDTALRQALIDDKINHRMLKNGDFVLPFKVPGDEPQTLAVVATSKTTTLGEEKLRSLFATLRRVEGEVDPKLALALLRQNTVLPRGAWAIQQTPQGTSLILFKLNVEADAPGERVHEMARYVASVAWQTFQALQKEAAGEADS